MKIVAVETTGRGWAMQLSAVNSKIRWGMSNNFLNRTIVLKI